MGNEQRRFTRIPGNFDVRYSLAGADEYQILDPFSFDSVGKSVDVSACGICFSAYKFLTIGDRIRVSFLIPNSFQLFRGEGRIVRVSKEVGEPCHIAVDFKDMDLNGYRDLDYFLKQPEHHNTALYT